MLLDILMLDALSNNWALGKRCITLSVLTRLVPLTGCLRGVAALLEVRVLSLKLFEYLWSFVFVMPMVIY